MLKLTFKDIQYITDGYASLRRSTSKNIIHITHNSKEVIEGSLFLAIQGNKVDGHDFIMEAQQKGAVAAIVEYIIPNIDIPQIVVPSIEEAIGKLGKAWRELADIPLVAITGSVGKTSTKELVAHILGTQYHTHKSRGNFNNELGVPFELMGIRGDHQCSVMELGMRGLDQIRHLSETVQPSIAVVTNIGWSHIEILKTKANIAQAKSEIFECLKSDGLAILNRDDDFFDYLKSKVSGRLVTFGEHTDADIQIKNLSLTPDGQPQFYLNNLPVLIPNCVGQHHAYNAAVAYAIAQELNINDTDFLAQLTTFSAPSRRGNIITLNNDIQIFDNTYNSSPDSLSANLNTVLQNKSRRLILVIGDILELGEMSVSIHELIGEFLNVQKNRINRLITVGKNSMYTGIASGVERRNHFSHAGEVTDFLIGKIYPGDLILLQGSNGVFLDQVVNGLISEHGKAKVDFAL